MKKIYLFLTLLVALCWTACSDDDNGGFDVAISEEMFSFTPTEGGAIMHYSLADRRINKVSVEYTDEFGEPVYKVADYSIDTLVLDGFNQAHTGVPVKVTFLDKNENTSESLNFTFDTRPSSLYTFFDEVEVNSYWNGFQLVFDLEGRAEGSASVYFVGTNPTTKERDTLFLENFRLEAGHNVKAFSMVDSQIQDSYTVVVTTEDNRQRIVREQVWNNVIGVTRKLIPSTNFELLDPFNKIMTLPYTTTQYNRPGALGAEYLFDGDVKGTRAAEYFSAGWATPPFTFLAGPNALNREGNECYFVLDIKEPAIVGELRFYMRIKDGYATNQQFDNDYFTKLPCNIQVYAWIGSGDYDPATNPGTTSDWEHVGNFEQDPNAALVNRWYINPTNNQVDEVRTIAELNAVGPYFISVALPFGEKEYRFFKLEFRETYIDLYTPSYYHNNNNNVTFHELEVYGQK
jgi:hypothetical protein